LSNILHSVFGNFYHSARQEMLLQKSHMGSGEGATPGLMAYQNKRYVAYPEVNNQFQLDSNAIKVLTGNENISGRNLYGNESKFKIQARQSIGVNDIPALSQIDGGIVRRLRLIKFETVFCITPIKPYEKLIVNFDKIELRNSMINLLLESYPEFVNNYFIPECVKTYTDEYLLENDSMRVFCEDKIIKDESGYILKADLKNMFIQCKDDYSFGNQKPLDLIKKLINHIDGKILRDKVIDGVRLKDVLLGWSLIEDDVEDNIEDDL